MKNIPIYALLLAGFCALLFMYYYFYLSKNEDNNHPISNQIMTKSEITEIDTIYDEIHELVVNNKLSITEKSWTEVKAECLGHTFTIMLPKGGGCDAGVKSENFTVNQTQFKYRGCHCDFSSHKTSLKKNVRRLENDIKGKKTFIENLGVDEEYYFAINVIDFTIIEGFSKSQIYQSEILKIKENNTKEKNLDNGIEYQKFDEQGKFEFNGEKGYKYSYGRILKINNYIIHLQVFSKIEMEKKCTDYFFNSLKL
ncbi:MAG: hypothetical protein H6565_01550 [Lewinellaceae bacterium]|nr:hypothetical protein [Lewinellaceae bacterium]